MKAIKKTERYPHGSYFGTEKMKEDFLDKKC